MDNLKKDRILASIISLIAPFIYLLIFYIEGLISSSDEIKLATFWPLIASITCYIIYAYFRNAWVLPAHILIGVPLFHILYVSINKGRLIVDFTIGSEGAALLMFYYYLPLMSIALINLLGHLLIKKYFYQPT